MNKVIYWFHRVLFPSFNARMMSAESDLVDAIATAITSAERSITALEQCIALEKELGITKEYLEIEQKRSAAAIATVQEQVDMLKVLEQAMIIRDSEEVSGEPKEPLNLPTEKSQETGYEW